MKRSTVLKICTGLVLLAAVFVPLASAALPDTTHLQSSPKYLAQDSPEIISSLKSHIAYLRESQNARMNGIIRYVDCLANGTAGSELPWIREDYLTAASSIPLMYHADDIESARKEMQEQSVLFSDETAIQLAILGGNADAMKAFVNDSLNAFEDSLLDKNTTMSLTTGRARFNLFINSSEQRNATLADLSAQGVDVTRGREISDQIDGERSELQETLARRGEVTIQQVNSKIKMLNQEFRNTIRQYRSDLEIRNQTVAMMAMRD